MSLDVPNSLMDAAERGAIDEQQFVGCVRDSLPYAWQLISGLVVQLHVEGGEYAANHTPPPDERARGQLLRVLASDSIRGARTRRRIRGRIRNRRADRTRPIRSPTDARAVPS